MNNGHMFLLYMGVYITILKLGAVIIYGWGGWCFAIFTLHWFQYLPCDSLNQWNFVPHLTLCTQIMSPLTLCVHWNVAPHLIKLCALKFGPPWPCKKQPPLIKNYHTLTLQWFWVYWKWEQLFSQKCLKLN